MRKEYNVSDMPLAELEQSFIEQYHVYLKSDLGLKPTTVSGYLKCLKYVVKIAFNNGWMPRNPFSLYQYTAPNPERSFLTEDELRRMMTTELRYKRQDYNRDMFLFSCFTGICYADMASLTYDRIEQDAQGEWWISVNRQKTETKYVVKLLPYALFILNKYRGLTGDGRVFAMSTLDSIDDSLKNIARECGIDKQLSFHLARHTYATTICLSNGVSLETLSKMLGHKNITTTQIYAKVTPPMIDREVTMLREKLATKFSV